MDLQKEMAVSLAQERGVSMQACIEPNCGIEVLSGKRTSSKQLQQRTENLEAQLVATKTTNLCLTDNEK